MNLSLDKIAPPVAFVIVGALMLLIGSAGTVPIGNPQPVITEPSVRLVLIVLGGVLSLLGPVLVWREINTHKSDAENLLDKQSPISNGHTTPSSGDTLEKYKKFARDVTLLNYRYVDAILLGPRAAGKTSIAQLWTNPWTQINRISPSLEWHISEREICELQTERRVNPELGIEQPVKPVLRLRLYDYPGEDTYFLQAIGNIRDLGRKAVMIFVMRVGFHEGKLLYQDINAEYFNSQFAEMFLQQFQNVIEAVSKVIIVFNKFDLLPSEWSDKIAINKLIETNQDAIHQIERVFTGNLEYHLTSALTNKGLTRLLGSVAIVGIDSTPIDSSPQEELSAIFET